MLNYSTSYIFWMARRFENVVISSFIGLLTLTLFHLIQFHKIIKMLKLLT